VRAGAAADEPAQMVKKSGEWKPVGRFLANFLQNLLRDTCFSSIIVGFALQKA
jgi:hypothetical protein